jgi:hypothetical protein
MMVGLYTPASHEQGWFSAVRHRAGRLLSAGMLSMLVLATIAAAPAAADPIGAVTINGAPARQCGANGGSFPSADYCVGSAPLVTIGLPSNNGQPLPDMREFGVKNDEADGFDEITEVDAKVDPGNIQRARFFDAFNDSEEVGHVPCAPGSGLAIKCPIAVPTGRGFTAGVTYQQTNGADAVPYSGGLQSVNVVFNYGGAISACAGPAAPGGSPSQASTADACTPPSHTRITKAQIHGHSAFFRFSARHAAKFECELLRNKSVMFRHSCHSPKPYTNHLPGGRYVFVVTGVNRAGVDRKPATKKFTIK